MATTPMYVSMVAALKLYDETPTGRRIREFTLTLVSERLTVRELIEARVRDEVSRHNASGHEPFHGLVDPAERAAIPSGSRGGRTPNIDADQQCAVAVEAFDANGFMLVDDRQVDSLDEVLVLTPGTTVSFVKLVPLVGG